MTNDQSPMTNPQSPMTNDQSPMTNDQSPMTNDQSPMTISAPGTLMIAGEHAVLHGKHALVAAVDQRVTVTLAPRGDDTIAIHSALGEREMSREAIDDSAPFHFLGAVLKKHLGDLPSGVDLTITADFPADVGLGSSSAVTVAALAAIKQWISGSFPDRDTLMREAIAIIRDVQGMGSGADAAAAVWGGMLLYKATPEVIARHPPLPTPGSPQSTLHSPPCHAVGLAKADPQSPLPPITLVYAGYKTPTPEVIRIVDERRQKSDDGFEMLFDRIDTAVLFADAAMKAKDWNLLGTALNAGQQLMVELGVCDTALSEIVAQMQSMPHILGVKISGSGLGDCVLGIGSLDAVDWAYREIPVTLSPDGVRMES
jgi:mevalonate kinase